MEIDSEQATQELAHRVSARQHLLDFVTYTYPGYIVEDFSRLICDVLEKVERRELTRVIFSAPPRSGKTELVSVRFPAWYLGRNPRHNVILASYGADLAGAKAKECRDLIESPDYQQLFPLVKTKDDTRAGDHWKLEYKNVLEQKHFISGAEFFSAGVGGPATGFGADLLLIDDYLKNWEDAQSPTIKQKHWDWWRSTASTRLAPNAAVILMATRWAKDDLIGRIIEDKSEDWAIIRLPALAETQAERDFKNKQYSLPPGLPDLLNRKPNEALVPKRYSQKDMLIRKRISGSMIFNAMYQGFPTVEEGNRFKREFFKNKIQAHILSDKIKDINRIRYWDKAATEDGGCYTAGVLFAYSRVLRKFIIEDLVRVQHSTTEREKLIKRIADQDAIKYNNTVETWIEQEPGSGGKDSANITIENLAGHRIFAEKVTGSKDVRLEQLLAQLEAFNVWLVDAPWNDELIEEFIQIPNGTFRDISDACGGAFNKLILNRNKKAVTSRPIITDMKR